MRRLVFLSLLLLVPACVPADGAFAFDHRHAERSGIDVSGVQLADVCVEELMRSEIDLLLSSLKSESELKAFVEAAGAEFLPVFYEGGYREWLSKIAQRCREGSAGS